MTCAVRDRETKDECGEPVVYRLEVGCTACPAKHKVDACPLHAEQLRARFEDKGYETATAVCEMCARAGRPQALIVLKRISNEPEREARRAALEEGL